MNIINCEIEKIPANISAYISKLNIRFTVNKDSFRVVMSRETHRALMKYNESIIANEPTKELTPIFAAKILFDDDIPFGKCDIFVNAIDIIYGSELTDKEKFIKVKHGEWKKGKYETDCICSQCNAEYAMPGKTNFCPNCGADMRERKESKVKKCFDIPKEIAEMLWEDSVDFMP